MSRLRRTVVPFRWSSVALTFTQGTASSVSLSAFLTNPQGRTITYSVIGSLPAGVTHNAGTVSYNGTSPIATGSVQFRASSGGFVAESRPAPIVIQASVSNTAPIWQGTTPASLGNFVEGVGGTYNLAQWAFDAEGDPIRYYRTGSAADTAPGTFVVNELTGVLTVPTGPSGAYSLEIALASFVGQVTGLAATPTSYTVALSWLVATNATGYRIERSFDGITWTEFGTSELTSYTDTNLSPSTVYRYRVRATDGTNFGSYSSVVQTTTLAATAPSGLFEPAITGETQVGQYVLYDTLQGCPNSSEFNEALALAWRNYGTGDYYGQAGAVNADPPGAEVANGSTPYHRQSPYSVDYPYTATQTYPNRYLYFNVKTLIDKALATGRNRGIYAKAYTSSATPCEASVSGRLSGSPPTLEIVTTTGTFNVPLEAAAGWTSDVNRDSTGAGAILLRTSGARGILRFDLSGVTGTVISATLGLYVTALYAGSTSGALEFYEADPPTFTVGIGSETPVLGLAAEVGEANLRGHPDVFTAGNFAGTTLGTTVGSSVPFPRFTWGRENLKPELVVEADGSTSLRGHFDPVTTAEQDSYREALQAFYEIALPINGSDEHGMFPIDPATYVEEVWVRMYVMLENDFIAQTEDNKSAIHLDLRHGYWVEMAGRPNGGYWQGVSGNGSAPVSGRHYIGSTSGKHVYAGPSLRMENGNHLGSNVASQAEWANLRPWMGYNYDVPSTCIPPDYTLPVSRYGTKIRYANQLSTVFRRGEWYCLEQHIRVNSVSDRYGPIDALGNGYGEPDGLLETWINGVLVDRRNDYRWRQNTKMGICQVGSQWYYGGQGALATKMHFRINHFVAAKRYIGPRVRP